MRGSWLHRVGLVYLAVAAVVALALAWHHRLGMPKTLAALLPTTPTLDLAGL